MTGAQVRLARSLRKPVAYVLAGGASFGAIQVGQLQALAETDLRPDLIVGTSVGALNGAVLAENPELAPDRLAELWSRITREEVFGGMLSAAVNVAARKPSAVSNDGLRTVIERTLSSRDFADLDLPHTAMCTDFDTGEAVPVRQGDLVTGLLASAAIPLVFPLVPREGRRLVDGGLVANVPIGEAIAQGARSIVVLDCGFTVLAPGREDTFTSRLLRTAAIMAAQQVRRELDRAAGATVLYLPGPWPPDTRPDEFARSAELAARARALSSQWLRVVKVEGPGRYGTAPADALARKRMSPKARALAEEAGVLPDPLIGD